MRKITKRPTAKNDLTAAATYLGENAGVRVALRFLEAAEAAFETLAFMPRIGVVRDYNNPNFAGMRMWPLPRFRKYLIFYVVTVKEIEIIRVLHGSQDIESIFKLDDEAE
jgi:toxin ParE1/3/4